MYNDFDNEGSSPPRAIRYSCVRCKNIESAGASSCQNCGSHLEEVPEPLIDLGVDLQKLDQGVELLSVHRVLAKYATQCNVSFQLGENELTPEQVFQPESLLPIVSIEALRIWHTISQRPGSVAANDKDTFEVEFKAQPDAFFPYSSYPPAIGTDTTSTLRLLTFVLAARRVFGMAENSRINLAPFLTEWQNIDWSSDVLPDIPIPKNFDATFMQREFLPNAVQKNSDVATGINIEDSSQQNPFASQNS